MNSKKLIIHSIFKNHPQMKLKYLVLTFLLFFAFAENSMSQVNREWFSIFNGVSNGNDEVLSMAVDNTGNVYVTGFTVSAAGDKDFATIKYSSSGTQLWEVNYNNADANGDDEAVSIDVDASGNSYVTGYSTGSGTFKDFLTIKYSPAGEMLWASRYNGKGNDDDVPSSIKVSSAGSVYVTGYGVGSFTSEDYVTIKYTSAGNQQWVSVYNNDSADNIDIALSMVLDISGNVYVTGYSYGLKNEDYATIKYNSNGTEQWVARFNGNSDMYDIANGIAIDLSGNVYVTGFSYDSVSAENYATIKYNSSGVQQWISIFNGSANDFDITSGIAVDNSGNVYVTGYSYNNSTSEDYATVKYNSSGSQQWVSLYNGEGNDFDIAVSLKLDNQDNVYVTGYSYGGESVEDFVTIKYSNSGTELWKQVFNGNSNGSDIASALAVDASGNVYTSGYSYNTSSEYDFITIKYSPSVGITEFNVSSPEKFILNQNFPNPFNPGTVISYHLSNADYVTLKIYDLLGKEVASLVNERQSAGIHSVNFKGSSLTSGTYIYKLTAGGISETKRMMLLK